MSHLDHLLDDALAGFDDDNEGFTFAGSGPPPSTSAHTVPSSAASNSEPSLAAAAAYPKADQVQPPATCRSSLGSYSGDTSKAGVAAPAPAAASSSVVDGSSSSSKPFDPLRRNFKANVVGMSAAAGLAGSSLGSSSAPKSGSSSSSKRPALTPGVHKLQEDLSQLMSEWSTAMHPEVNEPSQQVAGQQRGVSAVLAALAEQTQRTVQEQSKLRAPPGGAAAASSTGGGEQMNMIVDVVMQHLLSKEVLYQPMKEIMDKYPPWLDKHAGSSSSLSPVELQRYQQQYACIRLLCQAYETEPDNTAKIMQLLQEMQACGEPPAEIVDEMSAAIAADLPANSAAESAAGADLGLDSAELEALGELPQELRNCPVQ